MYKSPIAIITTEMESSIDDEVLRVTQKIGIDVSKDELIKALKYDCEQYEKGYADGKAERKKGEWIDLGGTFECSVCHERSCCGGNYCPDCGAEMEW